MPERTADVTIRPARGGDEAFVLALGERAFSPYSRDPRSTVVGMLRDKTAAVGVAETIASRVGFVVVTLERLRRPFGPWARPTLARVDAIAVHPDRQRRGVGRGLLIWAEQRARSEGAVVLSLNTATDNVEARALFEGYGFETLVRVGRIYAGGQMGVAMSKALL